MFICLQVGMEGEALKVYSSEGSKKVKWSDAEESVNDPITWYKVSILVALSFYHGLLTVPALCSAEECSSANNCAVQKVFDAPSGTEPVALDLSSMGKGQVWINGESIGRYWVSYLTPLGYPSQSM